MVSFIHAQLATTEIYTHVSILKLKQVHTLTHPARLPDGKAQGLRDLHPSLAAQDGNDDAPTAEDVMAALDAEAAEEDADIGA